MIFMMMKCPECRIRYLARCDLCDAGITDNLTEEEVGILFNLLENALRKALANAKKSKLPYDWEAKARKLKFLQEKFLNEML